MTSFACTLCIFFLWFWNLGRSLLATCKNMSKGNTKKRGDSSKLQARGELRHSKGGPTEDHPEGSEQNKDHTKRQQNQYDRGSQKLSIFFTTFCFFFTGNSVCWIGIFFFFFWFQCRICIQCEHFSNDLIDVLTWTIIVSRDGLRIPKTSLGMSD